MKRKSDLIIRSIFFFFSVSTSHLFVWNIWNSHFSIKRKVSNNICFSPGFSHPSCLLRSLSSNTVNLVHGHNHKCSWPLGVQFVKSGGFHLMKDADAFLPPLFLSGLQFHLKNSLPFWEFASGKIKKGFGAYLALEELESCPASSSFPCCLRLENPHNQRSLQCLTLSLA